MCLFKEKEFKEAKKLNGLFGGGIFVIVLAIILPFFSNPGADLSPKFVLAQLTISAVGFVIILVALCYTIVQFQKSMAKPKLEVIFSETSTSESTIVISQDEPEHKKIPYKSTLSILNTGNAITDLFQIDFEIPEIFQPTISSTISGTVGISIKNSTHKTVSFINNKVYVCFVNRPTVIGPLVLLIRANRFKEYSNPLIIPYKVYGDWAETQEGELKVNINKK